MQLTATTRNGKHTLTKEEMWLKPTAKLKRLFRIPKNARFTKTKLIDKIFQKYGKEEFTDNMSTDKFRNLGLKEMKNHELLKLAGLRPYKGLTKDKLIEIVMDGK